MIRTERLKLRSWTEDDLPAARKILCDVAVMEFSDAGPLSEAALREWLKSVVQDAEGSDFPSVFAIEHGHTGQVVGYLSQKAESGRVRAHEAEIGFRLLRSAWGRGLATEATLELIHALRTRQPSLSIVALVDPNNLSSVNVLKKLGMKHDGNVMLPGYDYPDHRYVLIPKKSPA